MDSGTIINNRYRIIERVGQGGTSNVYKVFDLNVERFLAMKIIRCDEPAYYMLAQGEIDTLKSIKYPLFPTVHDAFVLDGGIYILSEFVEGVRLDKLIQSKNVSRDEALRLIGRIADALSYLHERKSPILYLDLKPENIIVNSSGLPMIVDFGIARQIKQKGICMGTVGYSPPEQYIPGNKKVDERSDIFALGMTYMTLRTGRPPDRDYDRNRDTIKKSRIFNKLEKSFLLRATSYEMDDRFSSVRDAKMEIQHIRFYPKKIIKRVICVLAAASVILTGEYLYRNSYYRNREKEAAYKMAGDASIHMEAGEYTKEGMGIIKTFVQSGCLDAQTEQTFIYELARNNLYIQKDYKTAAVYYSKLDNTKYPSAGDYCKICKMISGFLPMNEDSLRLIGVYYEDILEMDPSIAKYEDFIIAAELFEEYEKDEIEGIKKAVTVLESGIVSIDVEIDEVKTENRAEVGKIRERMSNLLETKTGRAEEISIQRVGGM